MSELVGNLRHAVRLTAKNPVFTSLAVLSLAIGIGANTAIFTLANAVLLRPLPVSEPGRLVRLSATDKEGNTGAFAYPDYVDYRSQNRSFSGLLAHSSLRVGLHTGQGESEIVFGELVSENYFTVLGVKAALGRTFLPEEGKTPGKSPVVVLSHDFWRTRFGGAPRVIGSNVRINGYPFTVVGVAPTGFQGTLEGGVLPSSLWVPTMMFAQVSSEEIFNRNSVGFEAIGRLKPGVTEAGAQAELNGLARNLAKAYPDPPERKIPKKRLVQLSSLSAVLPSMHGIVVALMTFLLLVVGLVLLIACTNLANMLLVRMSTRARELATRLALGAHRGTLIRQLLVESLLLATMGGAVGLLIAWWTVQWLGRIHLPTPVPIQFDLSMDWRVLTFTCAVSLATVLFFGLLPALQATRLNPATILKEEMGAGRGRSGNRLRKVFVVAQLTLSMLLLMFAGLLMRSLRNAGEIDPGFKVENGLALSVDLGIKNYSATEAYLLFDQLLERVRNLPGVARVTLASRLPLSSGNSQVDARLPGGKEWDGIDTNVVDPEYFRLMGINLLRGRVFTPQDDEDAPRVVVVSEAMARRYWPKAQALGQRVEILGAKGDAEVVGVVADSSYRNLKEEPIPFIYRAYRQDYEPAMVILVRTAQEPRQVIAPVRRALHELDADLPVYDVKTLRDHLKDSVLTAQLAARLLGVLGLLTLVLAGLGVYGVMAYSVSQRTHEIGLRMSIGARQGDILRMLLIQGLRLVMVGIGLGVVLAFALTRFASSFLYGISSTDPLTFVGISVLLAAISLFAVFVPARRAMRLDPQMALRQQ